MTSDIQVITREKQISFLPAATKRKEVSFVLLFCFVIRFRFFHQASFFSFLLLAHMNNSSSEKGGVTISSLPASKYISSANIRKVFSVSYPTLRKWAKERKVGFVRLPGGSRLYDAAGIDRLMGLRKCVEVSGGEGKSRILYARVSSVKQKPDLERQQQDLRTKYPNDKIISDIGSGINWSRPGFQKLLDLCVRGKVNEVVLSHKDRLCRFAFDLLEGLFRKFGIKIIIVHQNPQAGDVTEGREQELAEDLLAIVNHFVAKNNGLRSAQHRKQRKATRDGE